MLIVTRDVASAVLMLAGASSCLLGALGLVRLPDLPSRAQAAAKPQTLGLVLILFGTAVRLEFGSGAMLVLVVLFQIVTAAVISHIVARSAYRSGTFDHDALLVDELAARVEREGRGRRAGGGRAGGGRAGGGRDGGGRDGERGGGDGADEARDGRK
ncbi:monovalent cation/H(+) antiporter subunit G [Pseudonocardia sp. RS010]|uniref:monovalent cation/H(+) antiporter subunit G n=1 Tax=Pseudonocardia sp. RS010 TaxID=3385979 RepID=UPI00399FF1B7